MVSASDNGLGTRFSNRSRSPIVVPLLFMNQPLLMHGRDAAREKASLVNAHARHSGLISYIVIDRLTSRCHRLIRARSSTLLLELARTQVWVLHGEGQAPHELG